MIPFNVGDEVTDLDGQRRGVITRIWNERDLYEDEPPVYRCEVRVGYQLWSIPQVSLLKVSENSSIITNSEIAKK